jgi:carbon monoxide dehydrogenase subunit G
MQTKGEYLVAASRDAVWTALNDPAVLERCIPGCEALTAGEDGRLEALVAAAVGPVRAKFRTTILLEGLEPPARYSLVGEGRSGAAGFAKGRADVRLETEGENTRLHYSTTFQVGGRLAQVGSRLVMAATRKTTDDFFKAFADYLDESSGRTGATVADSAPRKSRWLMLVVVAAMLAAAGLLVWAILR